MRRPSPAWFPGLILAVTVAELLAAVLVPGADQFDDKGWAVRLFAYPALMLRRAGDLVAGPRPAAEPAPRRRTSPSG